MGTPEAHRNDGVFNALTNEPTSLRVDNMESEPAGEHPCHPVSISDMLEKITGNETD